jgi:HNH endonuclease/NUMOD1 domain
MEEAELPEGFKKIKEFPNYCISAEGQVFSVKRGNFLAPILTKGGYHVVNLYKKVTNEDGEEKSKSHTKKIHRLVAKTFHKNPNKLPVVNHKNGKKDGNDRDNLEWATHSQNTIHAYETGLIKHFSKPVKRYDLEGNFIEEFASMTEAAKATGNDRKLIGYACSSGKTGISGDSIWKLKGDETPINIDRPRANCKAVRQFDLKTGKTINEFKSIKDAQKAVPTAASHLGDVCNGNRNSAGGFGWEFIEKEEEEIIEDPLEVESRKWKVYNKFPNYRISSDGRVYSLYHNQLMTNSVNGGYYVVNLSHKGKGETIKVHILVATLYVENSDPDKYYIVNHIMQI